MERKWWEGPMVGFDLETTSPDPFEARIVTASIVCVEPGAETYTSSRVAAPDGWEIPEGAAEIHGYTTDRALAEGEPWAEVVEDVAETLAGHASVPLVIFNARYDLTVLACEMARLGLPMLPVGLAVDPLVIDKWLDRFRKGSRKLDAICATYGATLDAAHNSDADALAACRAAWVLGAKGTVRRQIRHWGGHRASDMAELAVLQAEWEVVRYDLGRLFDAQTRWALAERERFAEYKRSIGEYDEAARIESEVGWPILERLSPAAIEEARRLHEASVPDGFGG